MSTNVTDVASVFLQLDAALCLLARAKGEKPQSQFFDQRSQHVCRLMLDGALFQVVITKVEEDK
jgi:hypothetical protein